MIIVIDKKKDMALLDKIVVEASAYEGTPSRANVLKDLATQLSVPENLITVESIYPVFGTTKVNIRASAYKEAKAKEFFKRKVRKVAVPAGGQNG